MNGLPFEADFPEESLYAFPLALPVPDEVQSVLPELAQLLDQSNADHDDGWRAAPVALYVHVPYCLTLCNFCGFIKSPLGDRAKLDIFVRDLIAEIQLLAANVGARTTIAAIYFGGGTPSVLTLVQIAEILNEVHQSFNVHSSCELSFEGEALTLRDTAYLQGLASLGFKRLSFGVQTLDEGARKILNLRPSAEQLKDVKQKAEEFFSEVNVDFIYGWPGQRQDDLERDLERLLEWIQPSSIEVFQFEPLDASPDLIRRLASLGVKVPITNELQRMQRFVRKTLCTNGFVAPSYTKYIKGKSQYTSQYDRCYYGWANGQVLGVGRGSQSFFKGLMWGSGMVEGKYRELLAARRVPINALASFQWNERESVTWPRRMSVDMSVVEGLSEAARKIDRLIQSGLLRADGSTLTLTETGVDWVPSLLNYLLPACHTATVLEMTQQRSVARATFPIRVVVK